MAKNGKECMTELGIVRDTLVKPKTDISIVRPVLFPSPRDIKATTVALEHYSGGVLVPKSIPDMSLRILGSSSLKRWMSEQRGRDTLIKAEAMKQFEDEMSAMDLDDTRSLSVSGIFVNDADVLCAELVGDEIAIKEEKVAIAGLIIRSHKKPLSKIDIAEVYGSVHSTVEIADVNCNLLNGQDYKDLKNYPEEYIIDQFFERSFVDDIAEVPIPQFFKNITFGGLRVAITKPNKDISPPRNILRRQPRYNRDLNRLKIVPESGFLDD